MIDATKLPRPASVAGSDAQPIVPGGAQANSAGAEVNQFATYPAKNLVLDGGRYYTADTKK